MAAGRRPAPPLARRLNLVYLYVRDLDRSIAFYRDVLGVPVERHPHDPHWAEATLGGVRFALHATSSAVQTPSTVIVDFETDDADAAVERLEAAGVKVDAVEREEWGTAIKILDPDGYHVDLFVPPKR